MNSINIPEINPQGNNTPLRGSDDDIDPVLRTLAVSNSVDFVEWLMETKKVEKVEGETLITMLTSRDNDNFNLAILAIEQLKK